MEEGGELSGSDAAGFRARLPLYERLVEEVSYILNAKLSAANIRVASLDGRVKRMESFQAKVARKDYSNPLDEITDLAGVRVVCHYEADAAQIADAIRGEFNVVEHVDKTLGLGVDKMGYGGAHFIVTLGSRYSGGRYEGIGNLKCEIQVRTVLQNAWAMISHQLSYKNENSVPPRLQRDLNSVSALLEIAQRVFDNIRDQRDTYVKEIQDKEKDPSSFLAQPLDYETLLAYTRWKFPDLPASDKLNLKLLQDLNQETYPTLAQIDDAVERAKDAVAAYKKEKPEWFKFGTDFITKSLGFVDRVFLARHGFAPRTREAIARHKYLIKDNR
jgi:ppGpp synthetase/RelA/SpoT-type nucleotidyltranferase